MAACPDPSAHRDTKLQEHASTAALYVTSPARKKQQGSGDFDILDKDNKLSSKGAAMSLKHAKPQDLPSFPSTGGVTTDQSNNAALLASGNHQAFEHWKPDASSAAGKAALLAKDYKMAPLWQPEASAAGSKAALLAAKDGGKLNLWYPEASAEGNSAAAQAMRKAPAPAVQVVTAETRNKALLAATASVRRNRAGSTPVPSQPSYPDSINSAHNALNAANAASRAPKSKDDDVMDDPAMEQSRIRHLSDKISKEMWTDRPPVQIEVEEKRHQAALRASAVSMAKSMYSLQQQDRAGKTSHAGATAATAAADKNSVSSPPDLRQQAMQYIHLQEAAQKLAEERLAKLDPDAAERYRAHYGFPMHSPTRRKLTTRNPGRRRSNSDSQLSDSDDERTSRRIRNQMSQFSKELDAVDAKKQQSDRAALMAAAERKVQAQMKGIDERVYAQTGKVSPAMMEQWEAKAREKAQLDSAKRTENFGKTDIGGGRFMTTAEIEAIAAARLKPTLDEITDNAEKRRARDEEIRLDLEEKKRQQAIEKQRAKEVKAIEKQTRQEEKATAKREKEAEKARVRESRAKALALPVGTAGAASAGAGAGTVGTVTAAGASGIVGEGLVQEVQQDVEHAHDDDISDDDDDDDDEWAEAREQPMATPLLSRAGTTDAPVLPPNLERHVSQIPDYSDSEHEEDEAGDAAPETITEEPAIVLDSSVHTGTDSAINKPAPEALDILKANNSPEKDESPRSSGGISKFLGKLRRRSKQPSTSATAESPSPSKAKISTDDSVSSPTKLAKSRTSTSITSPSVKPTTTTSDLPPTLPELQVDPAVLQDEIEAEPEAEAEAGPSYAEAAAASPSSFVRGRAGSDISDLASEEGGKTSAFEGLRASRSKSPVRETRFQEEL